MNILVPNLGSTSLKYQIIQMPEELVLARKRMERVQDYREAVTQIQTGNITIDAVAFKAVHGGPKYRGTFVVDAGVLRALEEFLPAQGTELDVQLRVTGEGTAPRRCVCAGRAESNSGPR